MTKEQKTKFNIIMVVAIVILTIATVPKTLQEDTYYMIKVGEYISQNGIQVIAEKIEPFAWVEGITYTYPHWLLDVVFYQIYNAYNFEGIYVFSIISGIIIYLLIYLTNVKISKNNIISGIITIASIYLLRGYITARAQVITFICLILEILFIEKYLEKGKKRYAVGLIVTPIILANCHAALYPIYLVIFLPYIVAYLYTFLTKKDIYQIKIKILKKQITDLKKKIEINEKENTNIKIDENRRKTNLTEKQIKKIKQKLRKKQEKLAKKEEKQKATEEKLKKINSKKEEKQKTGKIIIERNKYTKGLIIIFIICIFTGLLTPLGDIPYTYMIKSIQGNTMNFISEHQLVVLIKDKILLITFGIIIALLFSNKIKIKLCDIFMLIGMSILALISYKQYPIFYICTMSIVSKLILTIINKNKENKTKKNENIEIKKDIEKEEEEKISNKKEKNNKDKRISKKKILEKIKKTSYKALTIKGVIYISLIIVIIGIIQYPQIAKQNYVDSNAYPTLAVKWMKENIDIENMRLFNDFNYGSYLLFQDIPVFIDGRADVYDPVFNGKEDDVYLDYMQASSLQIWYEEIFKKYDITHIITTTASNLNTYLLRNVSYKLIYDDSRFVIYEIRK